MDLRSNFNFEVILGQIFNFCKILQIAIISGKVLIEGQQFKKIVDFSKLYLTWHNFWNRSYSKRVDPVSESFFFPSFFFKNSV